MTSGFNAGADKFVRPILDRTKSTDNRIIGTAIGDMNGYLPTHLTERSQPQGPDPVWNDEHCRNKRILIDDQTRTALASDQSGDPCDLSHGARRQIDPGQERLRALVVQGPPLGQFRARLPRRLRFQRPKLPHASLPGHKPRLYALGLGMGP